MTNEELYAKHGVKRGCTSFDAFCKALKLLDAHCIIQEQGSGGVWFDAETWYNTGRAMVAVSKWWADAKHWICPPAYRVVLLDGTVIREWSEHAQPNHDEVM